MAARKSTAGERRLAQLEEAIADAEASLRRLRLEMETEAQRISVEEPGPDGMVRFCLQHLENGRATSARRYLYGAIRVGNRWFTTGSTCPPKGYSWEELWIFIARNKLVAFDVVSTGSNDVPF